MVVKTPVRSSPSCGEPKRVPTVSHTAVATRSAADLAIVATESITPQQRALRQAGGPFLLLHQNLQSLKHQMAGLSQHKHMKEQKHKLQQADGLFLLRKEPHQHLNKATTPELWV